MSFLSATQARVQPSPTIAMTQLARDLAAQGHDILSLTAGEPDFDPPAHVAVAACDAIAAGHTRYTAVDGIVPLKEAIAQGWHARTGLRATPDQISVGTGGKQVLFNALMATLDPGDEVVILAPYWVSYPDMVRLAGGQPVIVPPTPGFRPDIDAIARALSPRSKWLILNTPSNPTGVVWSRADLEALAALMRAHPHLHLMSDDIYDAITYEQPQTAFCAVAPDLAGRVLAVNGVSKAHAMTGWRIGTAVGPAPLIGAMRKIQGQSTSNPCSVAQYAALAALSGPQDHLAERAQIYRSRRDALVAGLNRCAGLSCAAPGGAFYAFVDVAQCLGGHSPAGAALTTDEDLAVALLREAGVGTVFGAAFGAPGHLRLSFATSQEVLDAAVARLQAFCAAL